LVAEITIHDLLSWESRLGPPPPEWFGAPSAFEPWQLEREVSWVVTLRASMPILPPMRGGEIVILPERILTDSGTPAEEIVREIASRGATGIVVERFVPAPSSLVMLWAQSAPPDLESDINRMLTEQRGDIYRAGTELGRKLTQANAAGADVEDIARTAGEYLGCDIAILGQRGGAVASWGVELVERIAVLPHEARAKGWHADLYAYPLASGHMLWLGPVAPSRRAMTRLVSERIGMAADAALAHAVDVRPRGSARALALAGLLSETGSEASKIGTALGLPSNGTYLVALASGDVNRLGLQREIAALGAAHDATELDGFAAWLVEPAGRGARPVSMAAGPGARRGAATERDDGSSWIVVSEPVTGVAQVPYAARQARFLAALVSAGVLRGPLVRFGHPSETGVYRLLFPLWGTPELEAFARDTLGRLVERDRRGSLRQTLLAYLEAGGSQVEAANRLGVHRNTLAYRLKQIADLTATDPTKPQSHLALHMALIASALPPAPGQG
jgi:purine catabolism regulator